MSSIGFRRYAAFCVANGIGTYSNARPWMRLEAAASWKHPCCMDASKLTSRQQDTHYVTHSMYVRLIVRARLAQMPFSMFMFSYPGGSPSGASLYRI
jgi:hypothetical protein